MNKTVNLDEIPYSPDSCELFESIRELPGAAFLDSSYPHASSGRYDILCAEPQATPPQPALTAGETTWQNYFSELGYFHQSFYGELQPASQDIPFCGGLLGVIGYDCGNRLNRVDQAPAPGAHSGSSLGAYDWAVVQDHLLQRSVLVAQPSVSSERRSDLLARLRSRGNTCQDTFRLQYNF